MTDGRTADGPRRATTWRPAPIPVVERDPQPVKASLERVARALGIPGVDVMGAVFARWPELVGADIAAHASPKSLRDGVLAIEVDHPAWATQLRYLGSDLLARLSAVVGDSGVSEVRISVAGVPTARRTSRRH